MSYRLGIDLGTTYTAAAVERGGSATMASLGDHTPEIPSVLAFPTDGEVLVGDPAVRRVITDPTRIAREFKRRLGDPVPLIVGGSPRSAESLTAALLRQVIDRVAAAEGGDPDSVVVTVPANWGPYKLSLMDQVFQLAGLTAAQLMVEPVAAAHYYAGQGRVVDGSTVVVFDFGGGTFDAAIVRRHGNHFEMLGEAKGLERLGGVDLDHAVFEHAVRSSGIDVSDVEQTDEALAGIARLRQDCTGAKEALSYDSSAAITIMLPGHQTTVRLTRTEFEEMIRPSIHDAVTTVETMISDAGLSEDGVDAILLVGGSSRIPLVSQILSERLGRPIVTDAHPKHAIALGAASSTQTSDESTQTTPSLQPSPSTESVPIPAPTPRPAPRAVTAERHPPATPAGVAPAPAPTGRRLYVAAIVAALLVVAVGFIALQSGGSDQQATELDAAAPQASTEPQADTDPSSADTTSDSSPALGTDIGPTTRLESATSYSPTARSFSGEGPTATPSLLWQSDTVAFSGAVGTGGLVFTFQPSGESSTNQLVAFQGNSGRTVWRSASVAVHNTVAALGGLVAINDAKKTQLLNAATGEQLAVAVPIGLDAAAVHSSVTIRNGTAFAWGTIRTTNDERLYVVATDLVSGETLWLFEDGSSSNPFIRTIVDDEVIVVDNDEFRLGLDARTGEELWRTTDSDGTVLLLVDGGVMLVSTIGAELRAFDASTLAEIWVDSSSVGLRAAADGVNFYTTNFGDTNLVARRLADGSTIWAQPVSAVAWTSSGAVTVLVGRDAVYTVVDRVATARSKTSGELIWSGELDGLGDSPVRNAAVADGRLLLVDENQVLRVYGLPE